MNSIGSTSNLLGKGWAQDEFNTHWLGWGWLLKWCELKARTRNNDMKLIMINMHIQFHKVYANTKHRSKYEKQRGFYGLNMG